MGRKSLHLQHLKETTFSTLELMEDVSMFWMTEMYKLLISKNNQLYLSYDFTPVK